MTWPTASACSLGLLVVLVLAAVPHQLNQRQRPGGQLLRADRPPRPTPSARLRGAPSTEQYVEVGDQVTAGQPLFDHAERRPCSTT